MPADPEPAQGQGVRSDRRAAELAGLAQVQQSVVASRILNVPCRVLCRKNDVHEAQRNADASNVHCFPMILKNGLKPEACRNTPTDLA